MKSSIVRSRMNSKQNKIATFNSYSSFKSFAINGDASEEVFQSISSNSIMQKEIPEEVFYSVNDRQIEVLDEPDQSKTSFRDNSASIQSNQVGSPRMLFNGTNNSYGRKQSLTGTKQRNSNQNIEMTEQIQIQNSLLNKKPQENTKIAQLETLNSSYYSIQFQEEGKENSFAEMLLQSKLKAESEEMQKTIEKFQGQVGGPFEQPIQRVTEFRKKYFAYPKNRKTYLYISYNLTQMMMYLLNFSKTFCLYLIFNLVIDIALRFCFIYYIIIQGLEQNSYVALLITFLYLPRMFHFGTLLKILFIDQYNEYFRQLLKISYLFRSNFINEEFIDQYEDFPIKNKQFFMTYRLFLFLLLPTEISILTLPMNNKLLINKSLQTYLLSCYILKGIEAICFEPILIIMLVLNNSDLAFNDLSYEIFNTGLLYLLILDISKYAILSISIFIVGNRQANEKHQQSYMILHKTTLLEKQRKKDQKHKQKQIIEQL